MDDKLVLQLTQFKKALTAFETAIAEDDGDKKSRDSILLSYVFTFEMAWKTMKTALASRGMSVPDYAAAALKAAFQGQLIDDATGWEKLKDHRNNVSHAYDEGMSVEIASFVREHAAPLCLQLIARLERDD